MTTPRWWLKVPSEISKPLSMIFNCSFKTGVVPEQIKLAKVIPICKQDNAEVLYNYRPVSVLPCFSKNLERLMFNKCMDYIDKKNISNEKHRVCQIITSPPKLTSIIILPDRRMTST